MSRFASALSLVGHGAGLSSPSRFAVPSSPDDAQGVPDGFPDGTERVAEKADAPASRRPVPKSLVRQVAARLRSGRPVRLGTGYGDVILAPSLDAARWAGERCPGVPVFLPDEWRALLDCEAPDEVDVLVAVKRHLGTRLLPAPASGEAKP